MIDCAVGENDVEVGNAANSYLHTRTQMMTHVMLDRQMVRVGEAMRTHRIKRGLTPEIVRLETGVQVLDIERGSYEVTLTELQTLCEFYNMNLQDLFEEVEQTEMLIMAN